MHPEEVDLAFAGNHELRKRVHSAIDENPVHRNLFRDISAYILNNIPQATLINGEPAAKKRKLDEGTGAQNGTTSIGNLADSSLEAWRKYPNTSFSIPQRKKLTLELVGGKGKDGGIRGVSGDGKVEFGVAWKDIDQIFCLPVPEKAKRQHNFVVIPIHGDGVNPAPSDITPAEPIVWTFEEASGKNVIEGEDPGPGPMAEAIHHCLIQAGTGKEVVFPTEAEFESAIPQSHRKGEKAYHVKAHRGSKDGYLFFTSVGIVWGFKKPLAFFSFTSVTSIAYSAILRNTFNLNITTETGEIEFSMIDQADYAGIDDYVKAHRLQDASMAEKRRAQKINVNKPTKGETTEKNETTTTDNGEDGETELQKAERLLEDEEDEDEEDYDPGSEDDSDGSGSSDEEGDEEDEGEEEVEEVEEDTAEGAEDEPMHDQPEYDEPEYDEPEYDEPDV